MPERRVAEREGVVCGWKPAGEARDQVVHWAVRPVVIAAYLVLTQPRSSAKLPPSSSLEASGCAFRRAGG
jgi:hypothetical protein